MQHAAAATWQLEFRQHSPDYVKNVTGKSGREFVTFFVNLKKIRGDLNSGVKLGKAKS